MKQFYVISIFLLSILFSNNILGQHSHNHKTKIDERKAIETFKYELFMNNFIIYCQSKGYSYKTDDCLKNYFSIPQNQLMRELFNEFAENPSSENVKNFHNINFKKYSHLLDVFISQEKYLRNEYVKRHYIEKNTLSKFKSYNPSAQSVCTNQDFEANDLSGWTVSSNAGGTYVTNVGNDPDVPTIPTVYNGLHSACLNALTGSYGIRDSEKISQTFLVTQQNADYVFYVAVIANAGAHDCDENAYFEVKVKNSNGNTIPCSNIELIGSESGGDNCSTYTGWQTSGGYDFLDWSPVIVPLQSYIGQNVTIEMAVYRCAQGGHGARAYVEASCSPIGIGLSGGNIVCSGKPITLNSPNTTGYTYNWQGPNGISGSTYSLSTSTAGSYSVTLTVTSKPSCKITLDTMIVSSPSPTASFVYTVTPCLDGSTNVLSTSTAPSGQSITSYSWIWGDASSNGSVTPMSHSYSVSNTYSLELKIQSDAGCRDSVLQLVTVSNPPEITFSTTNSCLGIASNFTSAVTPTVGIATQTWFWGDATSSGVGNNPTHNYANSGVYTVTCNVTSVAGCSATATQSLAIYPKPNIMFSANSVCMNAASNFTNTSNVSMPSTISNWYWDFDNNGTTDNTTQNPSNTFTPTGSYNVELKALTNNGCSDSLIQTIMVNPIPTASFTATNACENGNVFLTNNSSVPAPANLVLYNWNFGIGGSSTTSSNQTPSNLSYANYGIKTITLTVTSNHSCTATVTNTVLINPTPMPNFAFVNNCINAQPNTFDANSSTIAVGTNSVYEWSFGDGQVSNGAVLTHTFATVGVYNTTLTITSDNGCVASINKQVEVYQKPIVSISNSKACFKSAMTFTSTSALNSGNVVSWAWDFNNNMSTVEGNGKNTNFIFLAEGSQTVNLTTTTDHGCVETNSVVVYVDYLPKPAFIVDDPSGCPVHCVTFTDQTPTLTAPETNAMWTWTFGDGSKITANNNSDQSHCYNNKSTNQLATYDVKLLVTTSVGCKDSLRKNAFITVFPTPVASYTIVPDLGDVTAPQVHFDNNSIDYVKWWWDFGDGSNVDSLNNNPSHYYPSLSANDYYSTLIVENQYGCKDTAVVKVDIKPEFVIYFPNAFTPDNFDGHNDVFSGVGIGIATYEMWVFDRWGPKVFYTDDITKGWNGKIQPSGKDAKQDVYVWKAKVKDIFGKTHDYVGHVTLLR